MNGKISINGNEIKGKAYMQAVENLNFTASNIYLEISPKNKKVKTVSVRYNSGNGTACVTFALYRENVTFCGKAKLMIFTDNGKLFAILEIENLSVIDIIKLHDYVNYANGKR